MLTTEVHRFYWIKRNFLGRAVKLEIIMNRFFPGNKEDIDHNKEVIELA